MNKQKKINGGKLSMKKVASKRAKLLSVLCLATLVPFGVGMATLNANADVDVTNFRIQSGAGVRLPNTNGDSGIRFTAQLPSTAFTSLTGTYKDDIIFFGIQLTGENGATSDVCYYVDNKEKEGDTNEKQVAFAEGSTMFNYYASVLYNEAQLKADLATSPTHNPAYNTYDNDEARIENFDETRLQQYLNKAYGTELSAKPYYQVGVDGEKVPVGPFSAVRSIWGAASNAYINDATKYTGVANKYFSTINEEQDVTINYQTGEVDYVFADTDKVYYLGDKVSRENAVLNKTIYANKVAGDTIKIAVVSEAGALTVLNATLESTVTTVSTLAYYDSAADKLYYTDENDEKQTLQGTAEYSFSYVVDDTTSYALADYTSGSLVSNVNYKYADSVEFAYIGAATANSDRGLVGSLQPRIITDTNENGYITAKVDYNPQTDVYTGVTVMLENADGHKYSFTNTVITSQMIDDATELKQVFNQADKTTTNNANLSYYVKGSKYGTITKGVYMLANDIDASTGFEFENSAFNFFEGVFDGRGHNIYNLDVSTGNTEENPGNGLFSAVSAYSSIQNVGFINVKASYGSVFQGNLFDVRLGANTTIGTYASSDIRTSASGVTNSERSHGSTYYRAQMGIPTDDLTTPMSTYLKSTMRRGEASWSTNWQNVYVKVDPATVRLMGVMARNMPAKVNNLKGNNLVIEYNPTKPYDSAEGANDGAFPYEYDYTGVYGVLYGSAYDNTTITTNGGSYNRYDVPAGYMHADDVGVTRTYYIPSGTYANATYSNASLLFSWHTNFLTNGSWFNPRVYVISELGLVSSVGGKVLGTNEENPDNSQLQFVASKAYVYSDYGTPDAEHLEEMFKLERYDSYEAAAKVGATNAQLTSYMLDEGKEENYWDISGGYLQWKNIPQTQE